MGCGCVVPQKDLDKRTSTAEDLKALLDGDLSGEDKLVKMSKDNPEELSRLLRNAFGDNSKTKLLDNNTRCFRELVNKVKAANLKSTKKVKDICVPKPKAPLEFYELDGIAGMGVPLDDEDWPDRNMMQKSFMGMTQGALITMLSSMSCSDEINFFDSVEEGVIVGSLAMKDVLPEATETFNDLVSDDAMSLIAFWGIGQVFVVGKPEGGFQCDLTLLEDLEVRPKFERYGANATFDKDGKIESIYWSAGKCIVKPGEGKKWDHAKWAWKASLGAAVTAVTHLVQLHWIIVNATHVASRQCLDGDHPVRRVLKIFLYNTGGVNYGSTMSLYPKDSFLHRMSALEYDGLVAAINAGDASFKYQTHPEFVKSKNLGKEMEAKIPICVDGMKVWNAYRKFFDGYVRLYFDEKSVLADEELKAYWECIENRCGLGSPYKYGLPALSLDALVDQITHHAFQATCWHEFVGAIVHYLTTPEGLATKIVKDVEVMDCQTFFQGLCLIGLTGTKQPGIMSDWTHLFLDDDKKKETTALHTQLLKDFEDLSKEIEKMNKTAPCESRRRKVESFNPKYFECSVSV